MIEYYGNDVEADAGRGCRARKRARGEITKHLPHPEGSGSLGRASDEGARDAPTVAVPLCKCVQTVYALFCSSTVSK